MPQSRGLRTGIAVAVTTSCVVGGLVFGLAQSSAALAAVPNATAVVSVPVGMDATSPEVTAIQAREDALAIISRRLEATNATASADATSSADATAYSTDEGGDEAVDGDFGDTDAAVEARQAAVLATSDQVTAEAKRLASLGKFYFPAQGEVGSPWGRRFHPILHIWRMHAGVDIGAACATPIWSTLPGTVLETGTSSQSGLHVKVDHGMVGGRHLVTAYLHMSKIEAKVGDVVGRGEEIGLVGSTGLSTACHLHLALWVDGVNVDPVPFLNA